MSGDSPPDSTSPGWFERIGQLLGREPRDRSAVLSFLDEAFANGVFDQQARDMLQGVLRVSELSVCDVMIPHGQMIVVHEEDPLPKVLATIVDSGHSRYPVIGASRDEVVGLLLAKDLLAHYLERARHFGLRDFLRPMLFVPETKALNVLLREFRSTRNHMAIAIDEFGGVAGLITLEDVLEEIVGEIDDEYDIETEGNILEHSRQRFTVRGLTSLEEFNRHFGAGLPEDDFDTIGGFLVDQWGRVPARGETLTFGTLGFRVLRADRRRIQLLEVRRIKATPAPQKPPDPA
ncbi:MAG: HlyC/CorC family transporter [Gammaproteobacteria bacterium]